MRDFGVGEGPSSRNAMPLGEAAAAASRRGVLRDKHGMPAHRSLPSVVARLRWREALADDLLRMGGDCPPAQARDERAVGIG